MKKDWVYKKLGEVANVIHGKNQKEVLSTNGKYPIYGSGGTIMGYATEYLCEAGTTILGRKGTINNPQFINHKFWNVDTAFGISARKDIDSKFLYFFIKKQDWSKMNTGTTLPSLTQAIVKNVIIPVPPLSEQKEIVEYLDSSFAKIDKLKENAAKNLEEAKALFQSALKDALEPKEGWEEKTLEQITEVKDGTHDSPKYVQNGIPFVTQKNITQNGFDILNTKKITIEDHNKYYKRSNVEYGDIIIAMIGANRGMSCIVDSKEIFSIKNVGLIKKSENINQKFLLFFLHSSSAQSYIQNKSNGGAQEFVGLKGLRNFPISFPSLSEQQSIVSYLDSLNEKVNTLQQNYSRICDECDALKQAILRQVFE